MSSAKRTYVQQPFFPLFWKGKPVHLQYWELFNVISVGCHHREQSFGNRRWRASTGRRYHAAQASKRHGEWRRWRTTREEGPSQCHFVVA